MTYSFTKPKRPVKRVFLHCSASDHAHHDNVATMRAWHRQRGWSDCGYHLFIRKNGMIEAGRSLELTPAAQAGHNTGTIAICLHGLAKSKFTAAQKKALTALCIDIDTAYGSSVTFHGHNEVAAKACPVYDYKKILDLNGSGYLGVRRNPSATLKMPTITDMDILEEAEAGYGFMRTLRFGDREEEVERLQTLLTSLGYHVGEIDARFGGRTRSAVLAFQADNFLVPDGIAGPATQEHILKAQPRPVSDERAAASVFSLAGDGSRIAQASVANGAAGTLVSAGGALAVLEQASSTVSQITGSLGVFGDTLRLVGPWIGLLVIVAGLFVVLQSVRAGRARAEDHRTGKTL